MPAFTREFERTLQRALSIADEKGHGEAGLAHLALALPYDADAKEVLRACEVDVTALKASLRVSACDPAEAVRVVLLNDDDTPMEFVVEVLRDTFGKSEDEARRLMLRIHRHGFAECGADERERAAAKVAAVAKLARDRQHPLDCVMEPMRGPSDALLFTQPRTIAASGPGDRQRA